MRHGSQCNISKHKRESLVYNTVNAVLPRSSVINGHNILSKRLSSLPSASTRQQRLIHVGANAHIASCVLKPDAWCRLLQGYVPADPCYTADV